MSSSMIIATFFDVALAVLVIWGFIKEDKLIEFEDELIKMFKRYRKYKKWKKRMAKGGK